MDDKRTADDAVLYGLPSELGLFRGISRPASVRRSSGSRSYANSLPPEGTASFLLSKFLPSPGRLGMNHGRPPTADSLLLGCHEIFVEKRQSSKIVSGQRRNLGKSLPDREIVYYIGNKFARLNPFQRQSVLSFSVISENARLTV